MRLLFLGDVGVPGPLAVEPPALPEADLVVANLVGAIVDDADLPGLRRRRFVALHNHPSVLDTLRGLRVDAVSLANNHVLDYDRPVRATRERLDAAGIAAFGAGETEAEAALPAVFERGGRTVRIAGFGWTPIGCPPAGPGTRGVQPLHPRRAIETARRLRAADPDGILVFYVHWGYELELWPLPAHRQLARRLVDEGVDLVVGTHAHVAQGVERMGGGIVAYGLGNWLFPPRTAHGFRVAYPDAARVQLALEVALDGGGPQPLLHWFDFDPERGALRPLSSERLYGPECCLRTPYAGLGDAEYRRWYRARRTRGRGLPNYADFRHVRRNAVRDGYLLARAAAGEAMARAGLKREQRAEAGGA